MLSLLCGCCLLCDHHSKLTRVAEETLTFGNRLSSIHCREFFLNARQTFREKKITCLGLRRAFLIIVMLALRLDKIGK